VFDSREIDHPNDACTVSQVPGSGTPATDSEVDVLVDTIGRGARVLSMSYDGFHSAFASQTLGLVRALEAAGTPAGLMVFAPPQEIWAARRTGVLDSLGVGLSGPVRIAPRPPLLGAINVRLALVQARPLIRSLLSRHGRIVLHCRSQMGAYIGILLRESCGCDGLRVVADIRSLVVEEMEVNSGLRPNLGLTRGLLSVVLREPRVKLMHQLEADVCARADGFSCVSEALLRHLIDAYGIPRNLSVVVPTCTSFRWAGGEQLARLRREAKAKLGLDQRFVVAYCGSAAPWQEFGDTIEAFRACRRARPDAHLLVLTTAPAAFQSNLLEADVPADVCTVLSVNHDQVQRLLVAADVGLLLRRSSPINMVASPIKFAEYIASGVPVLASPGIGDLDQLVTAFGLGRIIRSPQAAEEALAGLALNEVGAKRVLRDYYSWAGATRTLQGLYDRVCRRDGVELERAHRPHGCR